MLIVLCLVWLLAMLIYFSYQYLIRDAKSPILNRPIAHPDGLFAFQIMDKYRTFPYQAPSSKAQIPQNGRRYRIRNRNNGKYIHHNQKLSSRGRRYTYYDGYLRIGSRYLGVDWRDPMGDISLIQRANLSAPFNYDLDSGLLSIDNRYLTIQNNRLDLTLEPDEKAQWDFIPS